MVKRKCPDSGHLSHSRIKRRDTVEKRLRRVRRRNHINKRNFPDSSCSSPVSGSTIGSRSHNSQSRSHDTQVTNSKNKANSRDYEDGIVVSRVTEETQSHGNKSRRRYKRNRKNRSLGTEASNSCSRISDLVSVTHGCDNTVSLRNGSSSSPKVANRKIRRSRWRKRKPRDFHLADEIKRDVHPESSVKKSDSNKCSNQATPNKINRSSEMSASLSKSVFTNSSQGGKDEGRQRSYGGVDYGIKSAAATVSDANVSDIVSASNDFNPTTDIECGIAADVSPSSAIGHTNRRSLNNSSKDHCESISVGAPRLLTIGLKEGMSVHGRPYPYEDSACFSFQKENEAVHNEISAKFCGEECRLDIKDGVATQGTEALNCENTHADALTGQEKDDTPSDVTQNQDESVNLAVILTTEKLLSTSRKKLLVLDLNGLLADIVLYRRRTQKSYTRVGENLVLKRPFCEDFLKFCFERFNVGVWSSRMRKNVDVVVDYLMRNWKHKLLFIWDKSKCTDTGYRTIENRHKPLVLKELKRLWNNEHGLPWKKGEYSPSNTLLVDDSPCKAICNPPHSAIFPPSFNSMDKTDNSLGPGGDLRVYLERLVMTDNVQMYIQDHPFGQSAITESDPSWEFYLRIIKKFQKPSSVTT
ncbi:uncharacterized protein LOC122015334 [Zingiber officinale]|uniref:uncharacterized protein LOC122015334 n=1 Tax=Zingiber officinale TaxID=94328 RepID=UPI001C4BE531|nr:uncharacterized protein LOC122015334 [Zingiber officinale]